MQSRQHEAKLFTRQDHHSIGVNQIKFQKGTTKENVSREQEQITIGSMTWISWRRSGVDYGWR